MNRCEPVKTGETRRTAGHSEPDGSKQGLINIFFLQKLKIAVREDLTEAQEVLDIAPNQHSIQWNVNNSDL